jgi:hypothetical protein
MMRIEEIMTKHLGIAIGLITNLLGFGIVILSLGTSNSAIRLIVVLIGLGVSLLGIIGILNRAFLKDAPWKDQQ